jgi:hypothetical protein
VAWSYRGLSVGVVAALGCFGCEQYTPSASPHLSLTASERGNGDTDRSDVVLSYVSGHYSTGSQGFFLHRNGKIWKFGYAEFERCRPFMAQRDEQLGCLHQHSRLSAKLTGPRLDALLADIASVDASERVEAGEEGRDGGGATLELPGPGTRDGKRLEVATCRNDRYTQLTSDRGRRIIDTFRAIRIALPALLGPISCPFDFPVPRVRERIVGWWHLSR